MQDGQVRNPEKSVGGGIYGQRSGTRAECRRPCGSHVRKSRHSRLRYRQHVAPGAMPAYAYCIHNHTFTSVPILENQNSVLQYKHRKDGSPAHHDVPDERRGRHPEND